MWRRTSEREKNIIYIVAVGCKYLIHIRQFYCKWIIYFIYHTKKNIPIEWERHMIVITIIILIEYFARRWWKFGEKRKENLLMSDDKRKKHSFLYFLTFVLWIDDS